MQPIHIVAQVELRYREGLLDHHVSPDLRRGVVSEASWWKSDDSEDEEEHTDQLQ